MCGVQSREDEWGQFLKVFIAHMNPTRWEEEGGWGAGTAANDRCVCDVRCTMRKEEKNQGLIQEHTPM